MPGLNSGRLLGAGFFLVRRWSVFFVGQGVVREKELNTLLIEALLDDFIIVSDTSFFHEQ